MIRHALIATLMIGTACSAQPQQAGSATSLQGPQGPQPAGADRPVPQDAPPATIRNVPATTGRANLPQTKPPFTIQKIGQFDAPFAMAFLPGGGLLVTEKAGVLKYRAANGRMFDVHHVAVKAGGQGGLLGVAVPPDFIKSRWVYLTFSEARPNGSSLALARGTWTDEAAIDNLTVIWRAGSDGPGGQFGAKITFAPDGKSLFLTSGERQRFSPAQDPNQALGKILRLTVDGKAWPGNPDYKAGGVRAQTWTTGHRNPYGLVFAPDGRLWEEEMGPRGGDELNLIEPGRNYGWPIVSNGDNYSGQPIPDHPSRPDLAAPALWWNPSISPGGMILYSGSMFPQYKGSLFIAALSDQSLIRVTLDGAVARPADQWKMGARIRDVAQAPDGSIWLLQDGARGSAGALLRLTPER